MNSVLDPSVDWTLLGRYLGGEMSAAECDAVEAWIGARAERRDEMVLLRRLWEDAGTTPSASDVDRMWRTLERRMSRLSHTGGVIIR